MDQENLKFFMMSNLIQLLHRASPPMLIFHKDNYGFPLWCNWSLCLGFSLSLLFMAITIGVGALTS